MENTDFRSLAEQNNFILVVPDGTPLADGRKHWSSNNDWSQSSVDDVGFTSQIIEKISQAYSVDSKRIYATGTSNGGMMSYHLACTFSDKIAAIAPIYGGMSSTGLSKCSPSHATAVMHVHGTADLAVPWGGNSNFESVSSVVNFWVNHNNCSVQEVTITNNNVAGSITYPGKLHSHSACDKEVEVHLHEITGMPHNRPTRLGGADSKAVIWSFLSQFNIDGRIID